MIKYIWLLAFCSLGAMQNKTIELRKTKREKPSMIIRMKIRFRSKELDIKPGKLVRSPKFTEEQWVEKYIVVIPREK